MKDRIRVAYVIEKKEKQREEQLAKKGNVELTEIDEEPEGKKRKRNLKSDKNKQVEENNNSDEEMEVNKKGKNFYKKK